MEILPEGILLTDLNGVIFFCNQHAAELHELSAPDELIGCNIYYRYLKVMDHELVIVWIKFAIKAPSLGCNSACPPESWGRLGGGWCEPGARAG